MASKINKITIFSSLFWKLLERGGVQGIQFILQIILARLLLPSDYGLVALVTIFINLARVFVQRGFNTALIQKKEVEEVDYSSVFYISLFVSLILYLILFFTSPLIASFYKEPQLTKVLRVLSITLFFGAFNSIQNAIIARNLKFKKLFFSSLGAIVISGLLGILVAYKGFGVWALVVQQLTNQFLVIIILWFTVKWRPKLIFSITRVKVLFSFGWKLLVSSLIDTLYNNLKSLIIGKIYTSDMLGYFNRGKQFPQLIVTNINGSIQSVILPVLSAEQENVVRVKDMVRRAIVTSSFIIFPSMIGLAVIAKPLVLVLLTEKWLPSVPFLQIFCITYSLWPIHTANLQAINALGRSDIFLKLEIIKKIVGLIILGISIRWGVYAIALGGILSGILSMVINAYPNKRLLNYSFREQLIDIIPSLIISILMGGVIYCVNLFNLIPIIMLIIQIPLGAIIYIALAKLFKLECYQYLINTIKVLVKNKTN
ncbi:MAG: lipopolysaccharide biosynthesis protein [Sphaerochaetaceae bacterium]|nr:lipopolysaccharide biosynthesis protein [Sphaerochaetaceae bacterium]